MTCMHLTNYSQNELIQIVCAYQYFQKKIISECRYSTKIRQVKVN